MMSVPGPIRVFVAEDDYLIADDIAKALERAGAVVVGPVPSVDDALRELSQTPSVQVAILDIKLRGNLVFEIADRLQQDAVPIVFFSGYDQIVLPERFSGAARISKVQSISELVDAALRQRERQAEISHQNDADANRIIDLLPQLRLHARHLTGDNGAADRLVERALENAIALAESGDFTEPLAAQLHALLLEAHDETKCH